MKKEDILNNFCHYDKRNPDCPDDEIIAKHAEELKRKAKRYRVTVIDCPCDNCYYRRHELAAELLEAQDKEEEVARVTAYVMHTELLNGSFFNSIDQAIEIARKFVEKYPPSYIWGVEEEYDETIKSFTTKFLETC